MKFVSNVSTITPQWPPNGQRSRNIQRDFIGQQMRKLVPLMRYETGISAVLSTFHISSQIFSGTKYHSTSAIRATIRRNHILDITKSKCRFQAATSVDKAKRWILRWTMAIEEKTPVNNSNEDRRKTEEYFESTHWQSWHKIELYKSESSLTAMPTPRNCIRHSFTQQIYVKLYCKSNSHLRT